MKLFEINKIYNEDCFITMDRMVKSGCSTNIILTSPFYNTNKKAIKSTISNNNSSYVRYDKHIDNYSEEEYRLFMLRLFTWYNKILAKNGVILFNLSYGSQNTTSMWLIIADLIQNTPFTIADCIIWKKRRGSTPNNMSCNKLTRVIEHVFVICRKTEFYTFQCNKRIVGQRKNGQNLYENIPNFLIADNNDGVCSINKATYSSELCENLLQIYSVNKNDIVYDSFMGTGTTAISCINMSINYIGSEISEKQCEYAENRIKERRNNGV